MSVKEDIEGNIYGFVLVRLDLGTSRDSSGKMQRYVLGECLHCKSTVKKFLLKSLKKGSTRSCGCFQKATMSALFTKHKEHGTRMYRIWSNMIQRCTNKNNTNYLHYGQRGISVCDRWLDYENFSRDMSDGYSDNLELDRIDVNGDYTKENCRWVSISEQNFNKRRRHRNKSGRTGVKFNKCVQKWEVNIGVNMQRIYLGVFETFEEAVKVREEAELQYYGYKLEN